MTALKSFSTCSFTVGPYITETDKQLVTRH
jgi:hypothetical protein